LNSLQLLKINKRSPQTR